MENANIIKEQMEEFLEKGGCLSWKGKYFLFFEETGLCHPDKEYSGYCLTDKDLKTIRRSMILEEILLYLLDIIDTDTREQEYQECYQEKIVP